MHWHESCWAQDTAYNPDAVKMTLPDFAALIGIDMSDKPDPCGEDVWPLERATSHESASFTQSENSSDVKVTSCPECGAVEDIDYGDLDHVTEEGLSNPLCDHMAETFRVCLAISRRKNQDYASDADPLANFRACQQFGVTLPQGIMVRLSDKFSRIGNLIDGRDPAVRDERLEDTIQDAINYLAILAYAVAG
jgi:Zn-finger nucleic acid-binding protein